MNRKLTFSTAVMLVIPPLLWAGNAVVGRMVHTLVPPITLNFLRWAIAFVILLPLAGAVFRPGSGLWAYRRRFALLGLLGIGTFAFGAALNSSAVISFTVPSWSSTQPPAVAASFS